MRRAFWLVLVAALAGCNEDSDAPGPDLSGTISFTWTNPQTITKFYIILSDTTGKVFGWSALESSKMSSLPYPPAAVGNATLTVLGVNTTADVEWFSLRTYGDIPADNYFYDEPDYNPGLKIGEHTLTINNSSDYQLVINSSEGSCGSYSNEDGSQYTIHLCNSNCDLYVYLNKMGERRYLYKPSIGNGGMTTIGSTEFDLMTPMKTKLVTSSSGTPALSWVLVEGITPSKRIVLVALDYFLGEQAKVTYPEVISHFPMFKVYYWYNGASEGVTHYYEKLSAEPESNFPDLVSSLVKLNSATSSRISYDLSGVGSSVASAMSGSVQTTTPRLSYDWRVYTPFSSKVRMNLPQFPDDLLALVPQLSVLKNKTFSYVSVNKYNDLNNYEAFYSAALKGNDASFESKDYSSKDYKLDEWVSGGRTRSGIPATYQVPRELRERYPHLFPKNTD